MPETPNPTYAEIYDKQKYADARVSLVQDEVVRRLKAILPGYIDYVNTVEGKSADQIILPVAANQIRTAPARLTDEYINGVLVSFSVDTNDLGARNFQNSLTLVIYSITERWETEEQVRSAWDRGSLIRGAMRPFLSACVNADDVPVWGKLAPTGMTALPESYAGDSYGGTACYYSVFHTHDNNGWPAP